MNPPTLRVTGRILPLSKATLARNPHLGDRPSPKRSPAASVATAPAIRVSRSISALEARFDAMWQRIGGPDMVPEFRFHPLRKWRFDRSHLETKIAVEIEGGIWNNGRHTRGTGFAEDALKYNQAILLGWRVFRLTKIDEDELREILAFLRTQEAQP